MAARQAAFGPLQPAQGAAANACHGADEAFSTAGQRAVGSLTRRADRLSRLQDEANKSQRETALSVALMERERDSQAADKAR